jgi:hypothetical protein
MRIHADQLEALQHGLIARFVDELCRHFRTHHVALVAGLDELALRSRVADGVARAREHGFLARCDVGFFVSLLFAIGPSFDQHVRVRAILEDEDATPEERAERLVTDLLDDVWYEAAAL